MSRMTRGALAVWPVWLTLEQKEEEQDCGCGCGCGCGWAPGPATVTLGLTGGEERVTTGMAGIREYHQLDIHLATTTISIIIMYKQYLQ